MLCQSRPPTIVRPGVVWTSNININIEQLQPAPHLPSFPPSGIHPHVPSVWTSRLHLTLSRPDSYFTSDEIAMAASSNRPGASSVRSAAWSAARSALRAQPVAPWLAFAWLAHDSQCNRLAAVCRCQVVRNDVNDLLRELPMSMTGLHS